MGRGRLILKGGRWTPPVVIPDGGSGTPTALDSTILNMGMGLRETGWDWNPFVDFWSSAGNYTAISNAGAEGPITSAYRQANGAPSAVPPGYDWINHALTNPPTSANRVIDIYYDGVIDSLKTTSPWQHTVNSWVAGHINITATNYQGSGLPPALRYVPNAADPARNFRAFVSGMSETDVLDLTLKSRLQNVMGAAGPFRLMDMNGVNRNGGEPPSGGDWGTAWGDSTGTQASPVYRITTSNRTKVGGGDWVWDDGTNPSGSPVNSGIPIEKAVDIANTAGRDIAWNVNWNASPAVIQADAEYARDNLNSDRRIYVEVANEVWNFGFPVAIQARYEAGYNTSNAVDPTYTAKRISGSALTSIGAVNPGHIAARYIEKVIEVQKIWSTAFAAARTGGGAKPTLRRIAAWQHAAGGTGVAAMLDYTPNGGTDGPLKNNIDCFWTAPYSDPPSIDPSMGASYDGATRGYLPLIDALYKDTPNVAQLASDIKAACDARSIEYGFYEFSPNSYLGTSSANQTVAQNLHRSAEMGTWMNFFLQQLQNAAPGIPACWYLFQGAVSAQYGTWNLLEAAYETLSNKYNAMADYVSGKRKLVTLYGQFIVPAGSPVGTVVARVRRRLIGSTITINSNFSITDATAETLEIKIANATPFASAGTVAYDISETGGNPSSTVHTTGNCVVTSATCWTWNGTHANFDIEDTSGLKVRKIVKALIDQMAIASKARSSGRVTFTLQVTGSMLVGFAPDTSGTPGFFSGSVSWWSNGALFVGSTNVGSWPSYTTGDVLDLEVSASGKIYGRKNGGAWFGASSGTPNPTTDTAGYDVSAQLTAAGGTWKPVIDMTSVGSSAIADFTNWS